MSPTKVKLIFFGIINIIIIIFAVLIYNVEASGQTSVQVLPSSSTAILAGPLLMGSIYISDLQNTIYTFDTLTNLRLRTYQIETGGISSIAIAQDLNIYCAHQNSDFISCINYQGEEALISVGSNPCAVIDDKFQYIWTADTGSNTISSITKQTTSFNNSYDIGQEPVDIASDGVGNILVSLKGDKKVVIFNILNEYIMSSVSVGNDTNYPLKLFCESSKVLWVLGSVDIVQKIDLTTSSVVKTINIKSYLARESGIFKPVSGSDLYCNAIGTQAVPVGISASSSMLFIADTSTNPSIHFFDKQTEVYLISICLVKFSSLQSFFLDDSNNYIYAYSKDDGGRFEVFDSLTKRSVMTYM